MNTMGRHRKVRTSRPDPVENNPNIPVTKLIEPVEEGVGIPLDDFEGNLGGTITNKN